MGNSLQGNRCRHSKTNTINVQTKSIRWKKDNSSVDNVSTRTAITVAVQRDVDRIAKVSIKLLGLFLREGVMRNHWNGFR